jgi:hypothetical protein
MTMTVEKHAKYATVPFYVRWHDLESGSTAAVSLFPMKWDKALRKIVPDESNPFPFPNTPNRFLGFFRLNTGVSYILEVENVTWGE